jgi:hypothetical protein
MQKLFAAAAAALMLFSFGQVASAESVDAKVFSCKELTAAMQSKDEDDQYGASVILYWMHGYLSTEERGTVMDFGTMMKSFEKTADFCSKNPNIGVLTASQKFMGENEPAPGNDAVDLAILKCEKIVQSDRSDAQGMGQILMWLAGYHASDNGETIIDFDKFKSDSESIGEYCQKNQQIGFYTASEKIMGDDAEDDAGSDEDTDTE